MNNARLPLAAASLALLALPLAACASATAADSGAGPATGGYPVSVDNCGYEITVDDAPESIVAIKSSTFELLLALGLEDRIAGLAFSDGPVPDEYAEAAASVPVISDKVPSQEAVLALEPDMVFAGWESNLTAEGAGDRAVLASLGVDTYVAPAACKAPGYMPAPLTFDSVFDGFLEAGAVFGAEDAARALVEEQTAELALLEPDTRGLTAVWYSSGEDSPFVGAGWGAPQMIMDAAGLENAFADVDDTWTSASWEAVVEADPDVLVLVDAAWNTADSKIALLEANPATAQLEAVQDRRYVIVEFPATEAGVRNVDAVASIIEQLPGR
jgi:iron complex transport system substrate-binding protein